MLSNSFSLRLLNVQCIRIDDVASKCLFHFHTLEHFFLSLVVSNLSLFFIREHSNAMNFMRPEIKMAIVKNSDCISLVPFVFLFVVLTNCTSLQLLNAPNSIDLFITLCAHYKRSFYTHSSCVSKRIHFNNWKLLVNLKCKINSRNGFPDILTQVMN